MLLFPEINPVAVQIGPVGIHWYGISYVVSLLLALFYTKHIAKKHPVKNLTPLAMEDFFAWAVAGVVLGGRIGYVLFYAPGHFLFHPLDIFKVWEGGMSFHGGAIGVILAMFLYAHRKGINGFDFADRVVPAVPIGMLLVRLANFVNGELIGRPTSPDLPWSMVFPNYDLVPRHPSTLYEAGLEGAVLLFLLWLVVRQKSFPRYLPSGVYLTGYALARIFVENFRTPEIIHLPTIFPITQGQLLSLPMLAAGLFFLYLAQQQKPPRR